MECLLVRTNCSMSCPNKALQGQYLERGSSIQDALIVPITPVKKVRNKVHLQVKCGAGIMKYY